jgi:hypothetical protein
MDGTQTHLITIVAGVFVASVFTIVGCITLLRRRRERQTLADLFASYSDETRPMSTIEETQQFVPIVAKVEPKSKSNPPPDFVRLPMQPGTPDQVVLSIEPNEGPTREQRNIQKLIEFLKQETTAAESDSEPIKKVG